MNELIIRQAAEKDVAAIAELEKQCFADPWSYESVHYDVVDNKLALYIVAELICDEASQDIDLAVGPAAGTEIVGYAGIWNIAGEGHITNVAVSPAHRRKHIGRAMMDVMLSVTEENGITSHTLEVRKSNQAAINLYREMGFEIAGERKGYYQDNGEDAFIMWRKATESVPEETR